MRRLGYAFGILIVALTLTLAARVFFGGANFLTKISPGLSDGNDGWSMPGSNGIEAHDAGVVLRSDALRPSVVSRQPDLAKVTFITQFASGHGWTTTDRTVCDLNSADMPLFGSRGIKYGPADPGAHVELLKGGLTLNLEGKTCTFHKNGEILGSRMR